MVTHVVAGHRDVAAAMLGALLIVVAAERTPAAQDAQLAAPAALGATAAPAPQAFKPQTTTRSAPVGFFTEPAIITSNIDYFNQRWGEASGRPRNGFYPEFSNMITGAGWVSAGPGYRHYFNDNQILLDTSAALSWHLYKMGKRFELPTLANDHLIVGAQGCGRTPRRWTTTASDPIRSKKPASTGCRPPILFLCDRHAELLALDQRRVGMADAAQRGVAGGQLRPERRPDDGPGVPQRSGRGSEHSTKFCTWRGRDRRRHPRSSRLSHQRRPLPRGIDLLF